MSLTTALLVSSAMLGGRGAGVNWDFAVSTSGENILWIGPSPLATDGEYYEMLYTIQSATVMVEFEGIPFGPIDVTDMIPEDAIVTWQPAQAPFPIDFDWYNVITPEDQEPPSLAYDWIVEVNEKGVVSWRGQNLYLGEAEYDLGWPWGSVTVQINSGIIYANLDIQEIINPCYADVDGSGTVDVNDLLVVIGNWGDCMDCTEEIPGDVNYDDSVDVTDLLMIVGAWGSCP